MRKFVIGLPIIYVISAFMFVSCVSRKSITYLNNLPKGELIQLDSLQPPQAIIFVNDVIELRIGGENPNTVQYINQYIGGGSSGGAAGGASASGGGGGAQFTVDVNGNIELPKIGKVKVEGLTRDQARDTLTKLYRELLVDPIVSVKFSNFRFSVIGEVKNPGTFTVTSDKVNIFEALAAAGDITSFGHFENVHILRDSIGKRKIITVDLTDKSILNSPNYYINRYDLIYVEARALKSVTDNVTRTAAFVATFASILALILVIKK
jgi:polysaccharide export outer membrane protein